MENVITSKSSPSPFSFDGRIGRQTFWMTWITLGFISAVIGVVIGAIENSSRPIAAIPLLLLPIVIWLGIAMQVKRWHDRNKSGWMVLINFIPVLGLLWAFVELGFLQGTSGFDSFRCGQPQPSL